MNQLNCANCRYFQTIDKLHWRSERVLWGETLPGECRREPPKIVARLNPAQHEEGMSYVDLQSSTSFPVLEQNDWCGAFEPLTN